MSSADSAVGDGGMPRLLAEAGAVFTKEWRCELRTRSALSTLALFAITTLVVVSVSLGPLGARSTEQTSVLPVLLWVILLFAATAGLPRSFVHEEETHTATALRLAARPAAVLLGKQAYGLALVFALEGIVVPLYLVLMQLPVASPTLFVATLAAGGYGLATGSTLVAAMIGQAQARGTLFAVLSFPVLLPLMIFAVQLTRAAVAGEDPSDALTVLLLYDASVTVASLMLFPVVWNP